MAVQPTQEQQTPAPASTMLALFRRVWRRIENFVFGFILFFVVLYFVLQLPFVQNWLIGKITAYLSDELHTTVQIRHVDISFFDNLVLEGFYVQDLQGDTLLYAGELTAGLNTNIFSLLSGNKLEFNEITLSNTRINILRAEGAHEDNLQFLIDYFSGSKPKPERKPAPFRIRVQNLHLHNVVFLKEDWVHGRRMKFTVPSGSIRINNLDLASNIIDIHSVALNGLAFDFEDYPSKPLPERPKQNALPVSAKIDSTETRQPRPPLVCTIRRFTLDNGWFEFDKFQSSPAKETDADVMDYDHMLVQNIDFHADSVYFNDDLLFRGKLLHFAAKEQSGFELTHCEAQSVLVCDTVTALYGARVQTAGSSLGDTIALHYNTYRDYRKFNNQVRMEGRFKQGAKIRIGDIRHFSGGVARNVFFSSNADKVAEISGLVDGSVNRLNGRNLEIRLGENTFLRGNFDGNDMAEGRDKLRLDFDFEQLQSDMPTIRNIIPGFNAPQYFNRLGNIGFVGKYSIQFGYNHILYGKVNTSIGNGDVDMQLDLTGGREKAIYSGALNMNNFDLATWTGSRDFGKTSFRVNIADGSGLTLQTIKATLSGSIDTLYFKGYNYRDVEMNGLFNQYIFDGKLKIHDPNIAFLFDGSVNLKDSIPSYSFKADIDRLDLGALNLVQEDWVVSGKIAQLNLRFRTFDDLVGNVLFKDFRIIQDRQEVHKIDSVRFSSTFRANGNRYFMVRSDIADCDVDGKFNAQVFSNLEQLLARQYPDFAQQLGIVSNDSTMLNDYLRFNLSIKNTRKLTRLFSENLDTLHDISARGRVEAERGFTELNVAIPEVRYQGITFQNIGFNWLGLGGKAEYELLIAKTKLSSERKISTIRFSGTASNEAVLFGLQAQDTAYILRSVNLNGALSVADSSWQVRFNSSDIELLNEQWFIADDNFIRFNNAYFATRNFELMNGIRRISLDSFNLGRGLALSLTNFNLDFLNNFLKIKDITYSGKIYDFDVKVQDIFNMKDIKLFLNSDTVFINKRPYGRLDGNFEASDLSSPLWWKVFLRDKQQQLRVVGAYLPDNATQPQSAEEIESVRPGELEMNVNATNFPMEILQQFIPGISKTAGEFDATARLGGPIHHLGIKGDVLIKTAQFQLDYLGTMYNIVNQHIALSNYQIWANNDTIYDGSYDGITKHPAIIKGGLRHDHFNDWRLDCEIESVSNNFLILNTGHTDNELYYGQGIGKFNAKFTGTFARTNIKIVASTGADTRLYIPISASSETKEVSFIKFVDKKPDTTVSLTGKTKSFRLRDLKGLNFEMDLSITDAAEVQLIFDEKAGDIVKGRGEGDISLIINREGEFKMYGNYTISRGEYLFTLLNWVNKPFTVAEGGTINWYGDPYGAQISLDATYDENTSPYNFLREEIELTKDDRLKAEASKATRVLVTMHLKGELFKPVISFDLDFPNLTAQVKTLADNKLRVLRQDQNELTRQVFGLVVVGSFLPPSSGFIQSSDYVTSAFNTLTQVLSNQLSNYLTALATEWFGGAVSSIDFDIAYNEYRNALNTPGQPNLNQIGRELQVRLTSGFVNDRVTIQVGSQFGLGRPGVATQDGFLGEDVVIEIQPTQNRQWRLKVYQRTEPDVTVGTRRARYGLGISFRKDFDSFGDMMEGITGWMHKKRKK